MYEELNSLEPPITFGWFDPESIRGEKSDTDPDDVKAYVERALKHSFESKHSFILAPYYER